MRGLVTTCVILSSLKATLVVVAEDVPLKACCMAMTPKCLACTANQSIVEWCHENSESEWATGCSHILSMDTMLHDDDPCTTCEKTDDGDIVCSIADCQPTGCTDPWCLKCAENEVLQHSKDECCPRCVSRPRPCCRAMTPSCLACAAGQKIAEFCADNPSYITSPECQSLGCCYRFGFGAQMKECCFSEHTANTEAECSLKSEKQLIGGGYKFSADSCEVVKASQGVDTGAEKEYEYEEYEREYEYEYEYEYEVAETRTLEPETSGPEVPRVCCLAMTPSCLACAKGQTVSVWCQENMNSVWARNEECSNLVMNSVNRNNDNNMLNNRPDGVVADGDANAASNGNQTAIIVFCSIAGAVIIVAVAALYAKRRYSVAGTEYSETASVELEPADATVVAGVKLDSTSSASSVFVANV